MPSDPYQACSCGSGKKSKWCCQPIHAELERAFQQDETGQHELALKTLDAIVAEHPGNPEAWGRRAQLLHGQGKTSEAEESLDKAFAINPNYPFGYMLRGMMRQDEGEFAGALILYRKAIEHYDPSTTTPIAQLHIFVADCELRLMKPVAARAAYERALQIFSQDENLRASFDNLFGDKSSFPFAARRQYVFQRPDSEARRIAWDAALRGKNDANLREAARIFQELSSRDEADKAAWFNLGLCHAWLGDNRAALAALDRYLQIESDEAKAETAAVLGEVLRSAHGMNDEANYLDYSVVYQLREWRSAMEALQAWNQEGGVAILSATDPNSNYLMVRGLIVEQKGLITAPSPTDVRAVGAFFTLVNNHLRVSYTDPEKLEHVVAELVRRFGPSAVEITRETNPTTFSEVISESLCVTSSQLGEELTRSTARDYSAKFFEDKWIHRPLKSLGGIPPIDAVGHPVLRHKVRGAIRFLQDCSAFVPNHPYDFDRLRRKLGLQADQPNPPADAVASPASRISAMSAAELAALAVVDASLDDLETAFHTSLKLDARDLAGRFAESIVQRDPDQAKPDRYPFYNHLIQLALEEPSPEKALDWVNAGERADCEHNEGRRRNDFELRRAQILAKQGDIPQAADAFERLVARAPEPRYLGNAAEAMLSARDGKRAEHFAEEGLKQARARNDRDSEQYFLELQSAARKLNA